MRKMTEKPSHTRDAFVVQRDTPRNDKPLSAVDDKQSSLATVAVADSQSSFPCADGNHSRNECIVKRDQMENLFFEWD